MKTQIPSTEQLRSNFDLTRRQAHVALLLGEGKTNAEIARELSISPHTTRHHVEQVLFKLGVASRVQVAVMLNRAESAAGTLRTGRNRRAHDLYLRGRYEMHRRGTYLLEAARLFEEAVVEDPKHAEAYGSLALVYALAFRHLPLPLADVQYRIEEAARKAFILNPGISEPYTALAFLENEPRKMERHLRRAIALNPADATAHNRLAQALAMLLKEEEALLAADRAVDLDPAGPMHRAVRGKIFYWLRRLEEAEAELRESIRMEPDLRLGHVWLGRVLAALGRRREGYSWMVGCGLWSKVQTDELETLMRAVDEASLRAKAVHILNELYSERRMSRYSLACFAVPLGLHDYAIQLLEEARVEGVIYEAGAEIIFDPIREDPRFQRILRELRLPSPRRPAR